MSYHEIEVVQRWRAHCSESTCSFKGEFISAGEAEQAAKDHLRNEPVSNYSHVIYISQFTVVGRQP